MNKPATLTIDPSPLESRLVELIAGRYRKVALANNIKPPPQIDIELDLLTTHQNGCPLNLSALLECSDFDLVHDVSGIRQHLDITTGKLGNLFWPRCAR